MVLVLSGDAAGCMPLEFWNPALMWHSYSTAIILNTEEPQGEHPLKGERRHNYREWELDSGPLT